MAELDPPLSADFVARADPIGAMPGPIAGWLRRLWSPKSVLRSAPANDLRLVDAAQAAWSELRKLPDSSLNQALADARTALRLCPKPDKALAPLLAVVAESCRRVSGLAPFREQLLGAVLIYRGYVAEMATGEGKTLTVMLAAALRALAGSKVHVVTVNDYLTARDWALASPFMHRLGLECGLIVAGLSNDSRQAAHRAQVVYCSNKELVFDFLRERHAHGRQPLGLARHAARLAGREAGADRRYQFAIVDEADSVLLDEAMTPLVISSAETAALFDAATVSSALTVARGLVAGSDFIAELASRRLVLTPEGATRVCARLDLSPIGLEIDRVKLDFATKALYALHLLERDKSYIVQGDKVQIVDEGTGRILADRSWEDGLHQMVEVKEGLIPTAVRQSVERMSFQQFFRRYHSLAGATGTASEVATELQEHYRLQVVRVPLHKPLQRCMEQPRVFADRESQIAFIVSRVGQRIAAGQPVLVGTRNISESERLAIRLRELGIECALLNARHVEQEAVIVAAAGKAGAVTVATNMAGRGTDISLDQRAAECGGLHVILTELHAAQRIDRQLEGRCARQGDPGSFEMLLSLDPSSVLGRFDSGLLRLSRLTSTQGWPRDGIGLFPLFALRLKRLLQRLCEVRDAGQRRLMVRLERQRQDLIDY
jgi:preprotein translocase subunit SecA